MTWTVRRNVALNCSFVVLLLGVLLGQFGPDATGPAALWMILVGFWAFVVGLALSAVAAVVHRLTRAAGPGSPPD